MIDQEMTGNLEFIMGRLEAEGFLKVAEEFGMSVRWEWSNWFEVRFNPEKHCHHGITPETLPVFRLWCLKSRDRNFHWYEMTIQVSDNDSNYYRIDFMLEGLPLKELLKNKIPELIRDLVTSAVGDSMKGLPYVNLYKSAYALNVMLQRFNEVMTENGR